MYPKASSSAYFQEESNTDLAAVAAARRGIFLA